MSAESVPLLTSFIIFPFSVENILITVPFVLAVAILLPSEFIPIADISFLCADIFLVVKFSFISFKE